MKKLVLTISAVIVVMLVLSAVPALAIGQDQKMSYTKVNLGAYQPTGQLDDEDYDIGINLSLSWGRYLTPYLGIEAGVDSIVSDNDFYSSNDTAGTYDQENVIIGNGLTFTVKSIYPSKPVRMYAGGGLGLYAVTLATEIDSSRRGDSDKSETDFTVGAHVVAGLDFDISDRCFVNIEGKYRFIEDVDIHETVASIPVAYDGDLDGFSLTTGIGFHF